jgi:DNA-binding GntR family transcriptional regulator
VVTSHASASQQRAASVPTDLDVLAAAIRSRIIAGEFAPNQRLVEADLAIAFGASRADVRGALLALANEGLVERSRYRGARVRAISRSEAIEITEVRMVIEGLCAHRAAIAATSADRESLRALGRRLRDSVHAGDLRGYSLANQELHARVIEISRQSAAATELERLRAQSVRHEFRLALVPGRVQVSLPEHEAVIDAICTGDGDAAEAAMRAHMASVVDALKTGWVDGPAVHGSRRLE